MKTGRPAAPSPRVLFFSLLVLATAWTISFTYANRLDDYLITLRYSRNLAHGQGLVYNPGGERVQGFTSPLQVLFFGLVAWVTGLDWQLPTVSCFIGVLSLAVVAWQMALLWDMGKITYGSLLFPLFLFASHRAWLCVGFESIPAVALGLAGIVQYDRDRQVRAGALFGLAALARPDNAVLLLLWPAYHLARRRRLPLRGLAMAAALVLPWIVFARVYYGEALPQTLGAKMELGRAMVGTGFPLTIGPAFGYLMAWYPMKIIVWLAPVGIWSAVRRPNRGSLSLVGAWVVSQFLVYFTVLNVPPQFPWYLILAELTILGAAAAGAETLLRWGLGEHPRARTFSPRTRAGMAGFAVLVLALMAARYERARQGYLYIPGTYRYPAYRALADWFRTKTPPETVVASLELGVLGYYSYRPFLDLGGLVTTRPEVDDVKTDYVVWPAGPQVGVIDLLSRRYRRAFTVAEPRCDPIDVWVPESRNQRIPPSPVNRIDPMEFSSPPEAGS